MNSGTMSTNQQHIDLFWKKVRKPKSPSGCWIWTAADNGYGYGAFQAGVYFNGKKETTAHRISFALEHGPIETGKWVLHHCNNRLCVNPAHMSLGTPQDNANHRKLVGRARGARGEENPGAKLNWGIVHEIRAKYARESKDHVGYGQIAKWLHDKYGIDVKRHTVLSIVRRKTWKG